LNKKIKLVGISIPDQLLREYDAWILKKGFLSRADAVRHAITEQMLRDQMERKSQ